MNMFDKIAEAQTALDNGIKTLEPLPVHPLTSAEVEYQIKLALVDLIDAQRVLQEVMK